MRKLLLMAIAATGASLVSVASSAAAAPFGTSGRVDLSTDQAVSQTIGYRRYYRPRRHARRYYRPHRRYVYRRYYRPRYYYDDDYGPYYYRRYRPYYGYGYRYRYRPGFGLYLYF